MKTNRIQIVIAFGIISIIGIIAVQVYWMNKTYQIKEQQFNESIYTALHNVVEKMSPESISNENIINQLEPDYFVVNVNDKIDANILEYYLNNEFLKLHLFLDYEYGIYDCKSNKMVYGCYINNQEDGLITKNTKLKTYNEFIYYFGVKFPTKSSYVLSNMRMSFFFSIILFLAILFFGYALYFILQQKRRSELQTDFINNMTHEFKTPISSIGLASEVLLKNKYIIDDYRLFNYTKIIKEQNERLNLQVEKVLQLAKDQDKLLELKIEKINIEELIESIIRSSLINYEKVNGTIEFTSTNNPIFIEADKLHFTNIIHTLLDNSLKYCKSQPKVTISIIEKNNLLQLSIKDNGLGINKKYISQIFDKFFRVPSGNIHNVKGFGLGLYYVKKVIDQHHWKIKIKSEEEKGTEITLIF